MTLKRRNQEGKRKPTTREVVFKSKVLPFPKIWRWKRLANGGWNGFVWSRCVVRGAWAWLVAVLERVSWCYWEGELFFGAHQPKKARGRGQTRPELLSSSLCSEKNGARLTRIRSSSTNCDSTSANASCGVSNWPSNDLTLGGASPASSCRPALIPACFKETWPAWVPLSRS